ncbi:hypothetical protein ACIPJS_20895 [Streptomyces sp. NPDC086783]|uniref:hypothetical protein n=1 Tax=Streptomyces sp. NPDC086783 TaxID=3365758 RepID=UPI003828B681
MPDLDEKSWADAIDMYARRYSIAKVTTRKHEDWALDVSHLMHGDTADARGWRTVDFHAGEFERLDDPSYPFTRIPGDRMTTEEWKRRLHEIPRSSVARLLVVLSTQWLNVEDEERFDERRPGLEKNADVILSRFPAGSRFFANAGYRSPTPDYYERISGVTTFSRNDWDVGLFLVSDSEVGMVWSFDPR